MTNVVERFAPSPTGRLHLGHAFSALTAFDAAQAVGGAFRLRIEDIDKTRSRPEFERLILQDLAWLGAAWPEPVVRQTTRMAAYADALTRLDRLGLTYRCACTRKDIRDASQAPQEGGPDGPVYPGACRDREIPAGAIVAIRLNMSLAVKLAGPLCFVEVGSSPDGEAGEIVVDGESLIRTCGDVVLARKDTPTSYHLSVVVDDAFEGVTHVTRGEDLFSATPVHRVLQALLDLPAPIYRHHRLIRNEAGARLAKRADSVAISALRENGWTPGDIRRSVGL